MEVLMKELNITQMEQLEGGGGIEIPQWLECGLAGVAVIGLFGSIFAGNIWGIVTGPTVAGVALAVCIG